MDHDTEIPVKLFQSELLTDLLLREYREYQKKVGKFLPLPGYVWDGKKSKKHE